jgi:hypothetical protein
MRLSCQPPTLRQEPFSPRIEITTCRHAPVQSLFVLFWCRTSYPCPDLIRQRPNLLLCCSPHLPSFCAYKLLLYNLYCTVVGIIYISLLPPVKSITVKIDSDYCIAASSFLQSRARCAGDGRAREAAAAAAARCGRKPGGASEAALSGRRRHARGGRRASGASEASVGSCAVGTRGVLSRQRL